MGKHNIVVIQQSKPCKDQCDLLTSNVLLFYTNLRWLREDDNTHSARVNTSTCFSLWYPLNSVHSTLMLHGTKHTLTIQTGTGILQETCRVGSRLPYLTSFIYLYSTLIRDVLTQHLKTPTFECGITDERGR